MKNSLLGIVLLTLTAGNADADLILATDKPVGSPLIMSPGTISGSMFVLGMSNNPPNDVMSAWQIQLEILPIAGATGAVTFDTPASGTPSDPPNYIFGSNGVGLSITNSQTKLSANDFYDPSVGQGIAVPGSPGASLLQMTFSASSDASGLFGVYADRGAAATNWSDGSSTTQYFSNVPDGSGSVLIGEIQLSVAAVPEPASAAQLILGAAALVAWRIRTRNRAKTRSRLAKSGLQ